MADHHGTELEDSPRDSRALDVYVAAVLVGGVAALVVAALSGSLSPVPSAWKLGLLLVGAALAETQIVELRFGHNEHVYTWSEVVLVIALAFMPPQWVVLVLPLGVVVGHLVARTQPIKALFNGAASGIGTALAALVYVAVLEGMPAGELSSGSGADLVRTVTAYAGASVVFMVWNALSISWAVALSQGEKFGTVFWPTLPFGLVTWVGNTILGLVLVALGQSTPAALVVSPVILVLVASAYRNRHRDETDDETMRLLERTSEEIARLADEAKAPAVLDSMQELLRVDYVELLLTDGAPGTTGTLHSRSGRGALTERTVVPTTDVPYWTRAHTEEAFFEESDGCCPGENIETCYVAPLSWSEGCFGTVRVGLGPGSRLSDREQRMLRTFANQIASAVASAAPIASMRSEYNRLRNVIHSSSDGIIAIAPDARVSLWSSAAEHLTGVAEEQALGRRLTDVLRASTDQGRFDAAVWDDLVADPTRDQIEVCLKGGGRTRWLQLSVGLGSVDGRPDDTVVIARDVTRLRVLTAELAAARLRAEDASRMKSVFLANMSHEIRTPMNGVLGITELLMGTDLSSEQLDLCSTIRSSGETLMTVINDILDFSKIEAGKMTIEDTEFRLRGTVEDAVALFAERAEAKGIELVCAIEDDVPEAVLGDPTRLRQIVSNLVSNAVKFTSEGEVEIRVGLAESRRGGGLCRTRFAVRDTGVGIAAEAKGRLFTAFEQADDSTTRQYGGTGLGLAISKQLAELMGGRIGVESVPGEGSTFWFELPFESGDIEEQEHATDESVQRRRILDSHIVVLYEPRLGSRAAALDLLESWGMVVHLTNGTDLVRMVRELEPVAVLLPDVDAAQQVRDSLGDTTPAMILMAGMHERVDREAAERAGVAKVLTKPLRQRQLAGALMHVVEPSIDGAPAPTPTGRLYVDSVLSGCRVLVVEDNPVNRRVAIAFLDRLGCKAESAEDGLVALELLSEPEQRFDLVLMDCHMPTLDGFACTRVIRSRQEAGSLPPVPIVALTANTMADDVTECIEAGMDDHLGKPFTGDQLRTKLLQWIGTTHVAGGDGPAPRSTLPR